MPISNECLDLLKTLHHEYSCFEAPTDINFHQIFTLLTELYEKANFNPRAYKDEQIIAKLSSCALILKDNPIFVRCCRNFITAYQCQTGALDSFVDRSLTLKSELEPTASEQKTSMTATPFFQELQKAMAKLRNDKETPEILDRAQEKNEHPTFKP
jgi:hypothetical protein